MTGQHDSKSSIPPWASSLVNGEGMRAIHDAVARVEKRTSAEIVPMLVSGSSTTRHVPWIVFLILLLFAWGTLHLVALELPEWLIEVLAVSSAALGALFGGQHPFVCRWFTPRLDQIFSVERRALLEFHLTRIKETEQRTGVLIMASLLERRAIVLADEAIEKRLPKSTWDDVIAIVLAKTHNGRFADGMVEAIDLLGARLEREFPVHPGDQNELDNGLIIKT